MTSSADIPVDSAEIDDILTWISNDGTPSSGIPDDSLELDGLLSWIVGEFRGRSGGGWMSAPSGCGKAAVLVLGDVLCFAEASSPREVPQQAFPAVPSRLSTSPFTRALRDRPSGSRELSGEAQADAGPLSEPFSGQPASSGQLSEPLPRGHLMEEARQRQPRVVLTRLALPTPLAAPAPLLPHSAHLTKEVQRRQPRVLLTRLALPPGCISCHVPHNHRGDVCEAAECPTPACTTRKGKSRGHEQRTDCIPSRKRKVPLGQDAPGQKRRR
ncbi:uncharacterized protein LOC121107434 isoform X1 [Gallus gallus]|uniref:uncharacterized protein LOC121107434 isoform X1 n=1 Tax=Gallus gallus TaxID=9031 RepID=UPI001AE29D0B|nr:uncharacterized protein LOC121107434 isoform X1 [Gallus gallus]XP_040507551.1 uncharacterized protein LOC121107434 isoform X1 [Gallus gallus]